MSTETSASKHTETDQTAFAREASGTSEAVPMGGHAGAYRLGARLEPSGDVYEASHPRVSDALVIKMFPRESGEDAAAVAAFSIEAGRVSNLRHANIVHVLDAGILLNGRPFVAMERLLGGTLEDQLAGQGQFSTFQALQVARGLASALTAAHAIGVVHREIRPDNVFVVEPTGQHPGLIALLDFGVSRLTSATHPRGSGVGSVAMRYLAPEQARGGLEQLDGRTDEFGLAALLYRLLNGSAADPHSVGPFVRGGSLLDAVLQKALSQRPDDRFPSVALFFKAFEEATFTRFLSPSRDRWVATSEVKSDPPTTTQAVTSQEDIATREFFEEGDRGEANHWENAPPVADADAELAFQSFDRVPRRRGPLVAVLTMAATVAVGFLTMSGGARRLPLALRDAPTGLGSVPVGARTITPAPAPRPVLLVPPPTAAPPAPFPARHQMGSSALHGYAWSPEVQRLIPSGVIASGN